MKYNYYLALGSNLGDRQQQIANAHTTLSRFGTITNASTIQETDPFGTADQPFLNQVLQYASELEPTALLDHIKEIEQELGRQSRSHWNNREIDIDIILWDGAKIDTVTPQGHALIIPHIGIKDREFLLNQLQELNVRL